MGERRDPVPASAKYYLRHAREYANKGAYADAHFAQREAFNHLENAAYHEAEQVDKLKDDVELLKRWTENMIDGIQHVLCDPNASKEIRDHLLGTLADPGSRLPCETCIPKEFRRRFCGEEEEESDAGPERQGS